MVLAKISAGEWLAVTPFLVALAVIVVLVVVVLRRRSSYSGFHADEASSYVWQYLTREQRQRIALGHVAAMIEAESGLDETATREDLVAALRGAAEEYGARVDDADIDDIIELQEGYAERKGLL